MRTREAVILSGLTGLTGLIVGASGGYLLVYKNVSKPLYKMMNKVSTIVKLYQDLGKWVEENGDEFRRGHLLNEFTDRLEFIQAASGITADELKTTLSVFDKDE